MSEPTRLSSIAPFKDDRETGVRLSRWRWRLFKWVLYISVPAAFIVVWSLNRECETQLVSYRDTPPALSPLRMQKYDYQKGYAPFSTNDVPPWKHGLSELHIKVLTSPDEVYVLQIAPEGNSLEETGFHGHKIGSWKRVSDARTCRMLGRKVLEVVDPTNTLYFPDIPWLYHGMRFRSNEEVVDVLLSITDRTAMVCDKEEMRYVNLEKHASYYWLTSQFCWQHPFAPKYNH